MFHAGFCRSLGIRLEDGIKSDLGGIVTLAKDQVKEIVKRKPAEIEYDKKRHLFPDTVEGQWELADWCQANHLGEARKTAALEIALRWQLKDGKIIEHQAFFDTAKLLAQQGRVVITPP